MFKSLGTEVSFSFPVHTAQLFSKLLFPTGGGGKPLLPATHRPLFESVLKSLGKIQTEEKTLNLWRVRLGMIGTRLVIYGGTSAGPLTEKKYRAQALKLGLQILSSIGSIDPARATNIRDLIAHPAYSQKLFHYFGDEHTGDLGAKICGSRVNVGLFASRNFQPEEKIVGARGPELTFLETLRKGYRESDAMQIGENRYVDLEDPLRSVNHSCNPNAKITPQLDLVARNNIRRGDEITFDYSTTMDENYWTMSCCCGQRNCRKVIRDFVTLPKKLQRQYIIERGVPEFIMPRDTK